MQEFSLVTQGVSSRATAMINPDFRYKIGDCCTSAFKKTIMFSIRFIGRIVDWLIR